METHDQAPFLKSFGKNLSEIRRSKDFSQEKLSFACGLDVTTISKIERGLLNISSYNAYKIATALNVHVRQLYDFEIKGKSQP